MKFIRTFTAAAYLLAAATAVTAQGVVEINGDVTSVTPAAPAPTYKVVACPVVPGAPLTAEVRVCRQYTGPDGLTFVVVGEPITRAALQARQADLARLRAQQEADSTEIRATAAQAKAMRQAAEDQRLKAGSQPSRVGN